MAIKHHNQEYDGGSPNLPLALGDRYYSQDLGRDFNYLRNLAGKVLADLGQTLPALVSGGVVTKGAGDTLNITPAVGYVSHEVDLPDAFSSIPPAVIQEDIVLRAESTQQTNMAILSAVLDGSTVNYVKLRYAEVDGDSRARAKKAGSYYYEQSAGFSIVVDPTANTGYDVLLATFTGTGGGAFTITDNLPQISAFTRTLWDDPTAAIHLATLGFSSFIAGIIGDADAAARRVSISAAAGVEIQNVTDSDVALTAVPRGYKVVRVITSAVDRDVNLPTAASCIGMTVHVVKLDPGTGKVIVDPNGSETIGESTSTTFELYNEGEWVTLISNGDSWDVVGTSGAMLEVKLSTRQSQASPTIGVWYNIWGSLTVPKGMWWLEYNVNVSRNTVGACDVHTTLSTSSSSESHIDFSTRSHISNVTNNIANLYTNVSRKKRILIVGQTTYYLNLMTGNETGSGSLYIEGAEGTAFIRATRIG